MWYSIANKQILVSVIVKICKERSPAPVCLKNSSQLSYLAQGDLTINLSVIQLEHISDKLRRIASLQLVLYLL